MVRAWSKEQEELGTGLRAALAMHVDGISVCITGAQDMILVQGGLQLATRMAVFLTQLGMKLDLMDKAFALASEPALVAQLHAAMGELGGKANKSVRNVGVEYAI